MKIFVICPVRGAEEEKIAKMRELVAAFESDGHEVYWPHRDTEQDDPSGGVRICSQNISAIWNCRLILCWWDEKSEGSRFDLGSAFTLAKPLLLLNVNDVWDMFREDARPKSFLKVVVAWDMFTRLSILDALTVHPDRMCLTDNRHLARCLSENPAIRARFLGGIREEKMETCLTQSKLFTMSQQGQSVSTETPTTATPGSISS